MQSVNKRVSFGASVSDIRKALDVAVSTNHAKKTICPSKKDYLTNNLLPKLEGINENRVIRLNEELKLDVSEESPLGKLIEWLNLKSIFKCGGGDNCNCGQNMTNKKFLNNIFNQLGLENPDVIEIGK